jgi:hypothetical protein
VSTAPGGESNRGDSANQGLDLSNPAAAMANVNVSEFSKVYVLSLGKFLLDEKIPVFLYVHFGLIFSTWFPSDSFLAFLE